MTKEEKVITKNLVSLSDLKLGEEATIHSIDDEKRAIQFMEMGCVPGERIILQDIAPLGDPIAIKVAGYKLSLRKRDAQFIKVIKD